TSRRDPEPNAGEARARLRADATAAELDELLDDRQPDPGAAASAVARLVDAVEALEHVRQVRCRNLLAGVRDADRCDAVAAFGGDRHAAAGRRVADRVLQQVR